MNFINEEKKTTKVLEIVNSKQNIDKNDKIFYFSIFELGTILISLSFFIAILIKFFK